MSFTQVAKPINLRMTLENDDLFRSSTTQDYPLGMIVEVEEDGGSAVPSNKRKRFRYVQAHAALTAFVPYITNLIYSAGQTYWRTAAPATFAGINEICVPQYAAAISEYVWVQIEGDCTALIAAAVVAGNYLELLNAGVSLADDGATQTVTSTAILKVATGGAASSTITLLGKGNQIA